MPPLRRPIRAALPVAAIAAALYALVVAPLILSGHISQRNFVDQNRFHLRAIFRFADQWPRLDFADYESATTPAYHVLLAFLHIWVTDSLLHLRLIALTFGAATVAILAFALARRLPGPHALALALPLALSPYVVCSGAYLLPDNAAWCLVAALLVLALRPRFALASTLLAGLLLLTLVLTRQIHLWAAAVVWTAAAAQVLTPPDDDGYRPGELALPLIDPARPVQVVTRAALALAATLPAFLAVAYFIRLWGGLAPPSFHAANADPQTNLATAVAGINPATPGFILAIVAFVATPMLTYLWPLRARLPLTAIALGAAVGFLAAALPLTSWSLDQGRYSGLWNIPRHLPQTTLLGRSLPIIALATVGGAIVAALLTLLTRRERLIFAAALVAFVTAHTLSALAWQRYFEPFLILWSALAIASIARRTGPPPPWAPLGPLTLTALMAAASWQATA